MGYPTPPQPSESLDWRGFCKNGPQNLEGKELRGQNLENKGLTSFFEIGVCAASALTMFYFPGCGLQDCKVRCHTRIAVSVDFEIPTL